MDESLELAGKVAVVTGGGTGLGREMALALAGAGADLAVVGRRPKPLEDVARDAADLGRRALAVTADVTDPDRVGDMFQKVLNELGRVDVLVNNAGMVTAHGGTPIWEIPVEEFRAGLEANLTSAFLCSQGIARHMVERGRRQDHQRLIRLWPQGRPGQLRLRLRQGRRHTAHPHARDEPRKVRRDEQLHRARLLPDRGDRKRPGRCCRGLTSYPWAGSETRRSWAP